MNCETLIEKYVNDRDESVINRLGERTCDKLKAETFFFVNWNFILVLLSKNLSFVDFVISIG